MWARQRGATFLGMMIIVAIVGFAVYAGIRLLPVYLEYMSISRAITQVAEENKNNNVGVQQLRTLLIRRWMVDDIKTITADEVEIKTVPGMLYMHTDYRAEVPFVANVSLVVDFDKTVEFNNKE